MHVFTSWQITSYIGFASRLGSDLVAGPYALECLYLAGAFAGVVYGAFFITLLSMPLYGGRTFDNNGYPPFQAMGLRLDTQRDGFSSSDCPSARRYRAGSPDPREFE